MHDIFFPENEDLPVGKIVGKRYRIIKKLGEGGCGCVYKVQDVDKEEAFHALKVEFHNSTIGSVLKMEVQILQLLEKKRHVAKLIASGKRPTFTYMVMTLLGESLHNLSRKFGPTINVSTQMRVAICVLYGLKQLHDVGYIHRDLKPANVAAGLNNTPEERFFLILDFGLSRQYIIQEPDGKAVMRRPREKAMFRGTTRYCSMAMHDRSDQGRVDDLWALLYMLSELRRPLPWSDMSNKDAVSDLKKKTADEVLLSKSPHELLEFSAYIRTLTYYDRPDYERIFTVFNKVMKEGSFKWSDPYHWDPLADRKEKKVRLLGKSPARSPLRHEDSSKGSSSLQGTVETETPYFTAADFQTNPLGF
ncbi:unnamed protein product [Caenorhabditis auriculariae]|uniref:Protein kinase domain-containing protein n=1 Tax=Caenorhabditis auriculariae TaxID=2777116 RepID=A0A8S1HUC7_9PELO|nr:unnamed protein product [Caenorhabditis auriculariae]